MEKQYTPDEIKELRNSFTKIPAITPVSQNEINEKQYQFDLAQFLCKNPSANEKRYIEYRIIVLEKVLGEYYETADMYEGEDMDGKELIDGNLITTKTGTASDYWYHKDEFDFLKDKFQELTDPKQIEAVSKKNPFPLVFVGIDSSVYDAFIEYTKKHIIEVYTDFSYLKKRMQHEKLIHDIKDNHFMKVIFEDMKLINKKDHENYLIERKLKSLRKSSHEHRENNFNIIFETLI